MDLFPEIGFSSCRIKLDKLRSVSGRTGVSSGHTLVLGSSGGISSLPPKTIKAFQISEQGTHRSPRKTFVPQSELTLDFHHTTKYPGSSTYIFSRQGGGGFFLIGFTL